MGKANEYVLEGWLLKKKRKKMQGFAKRYFFLNDKGVLSYALNPKAQIRDSLFVGLAHIGRNKQQMAMHVDSGSTVMHIKFTSEKDFEKWTAAFRKFIQIQDDKMQQSAGGKGRRATALVASDNGETVPIDLTSIFNSVAKMSNPIKEIEDIYNDLKKEDLKGDNASTSPGGPKGISKIFKRGGSVKEKSNGHGSGAQADDLVKQLGQAVSTLRDQHAKLVNTINSSAPAFSPMGETPAGTNESVSYASRNAIGFSDGPGATMNQYDDDDEGTVGSYEDAETGGAVYDLEDQSELDDELEDEEEDEDESAGAEDEDDESEHAVQAASGKREDDDEAADKAVVEAEDKVKRRDQLPAPVSGDEFSMFSMLKKNMGKDLSKISFPVSFNEPLSALQRLCEEVEYTPLLHKAAKAEDPTDKLIYVAAFAVSSYASTKYRSSRKPFNPLLGETYECIRPDKGLTFVSEKVSHHPPVMACWAQGKDWEYWAHSAARQKFWGRSLEVIPDGGTKLKFKNSDDVFTWNKPSSFIRNIMSGQKYLEHVGEMTVKNETTGEKCVISFKEGSTWGGESSRNKVVGHAYDKGGKSVAEIEGKWDESLSRKTGDDHLQVIWKCAEFPKDAPKYYGFSKFAVQLNEITDDIKDLIPPTDTRLRPDQRAFEEGKVDEAEEGKKRVEDKQRGKRKAWEDEGKDPSPPQFFEKKGNEWVYNGGYMEKREKKEWVDLDLF